MKNIIALLIFVFIAEISWSQEAAKLPVKKAVAVPAPAIHKVKMANPKPAVAAPVKPVVKTPSKPVATRPATVKPTPTKSAPVQATKARAPEKENSNIEKTPKAIFLIKRAKVDADIGEPVLYPFDRQLSNLYYDLPNGVIRND